MNSVEYLVGSEHIVATPLCVFDGGVCAFIAELSAALRNSPLSRAMPDLMALAFWGRKANLLKLQQNFGDCSGRLGRGLCFHITPANIPVNFAFSYLFSLLAGNANIVRVPSRKFPQIDAFCDILRKVIKKYPEVEERTALVRYARDNDITAVFSSRADARMIWGGDATIAALRAMPVKPRCVDITFADRYSIALLDGAAIRDADDHQLRQLAVDFYNDTFLMDQNACSSPQLLLWQNDDAGGRKRFWDAVEVVARTKYEFQDVVAVDKYTTLCEEAVTNNSIRSTTRTGNLIYRIELTTLTPDIVEQRGYGGFFHEYSLMNWKELFDVATEKFQTITCFGVDMKTLRDAAISTQCRGIDRIVPVGKAMNIGYIWDGHDVISNISRIIMVY